MKSIHLLAFSVALLLAACQPPPEGAPAPTQTSEVSPTWTMSETAEVVPTSTAIPPTETSIPPTPEPIATSSTVVVPESLKNTTLSFEVPQNMEQIKKWPMVKWQEEILSGSIPDYLNELLRTGIIEGPMFPEDTLFLEDHGYKMTDFSLDLYQKYGRATVFEINNEVGNSVASDPNRRQEKFLTGFRTSLNGKESVVFYNIWHSKDGTNSLVPYIVDMERLTNIISDFPQFFLFNGNTHSINVPFWYKDNTVCLSQENAGICEYYFDSQNTLLRNQLLEKWATNMKPPDEIKNWPQIVGAMRISR